ncbi:MAG: hypothetical protein Kow0077_04430 [Anaerolineae bacterium]
MKWNSKVIGLILALVTVMTVGAGLATAQGPARGEAAIGARALIGALSELSGLSPQELLQDVEPGVTTLNDVAARHNIAPETVVAQASTTIHEHIEQAVADGRLERARADEILATLDSDLQALMASPIPNRLPDGEDLARRIQEMGERTLIGALVEATGQEPQALLQQARENGYTTLAEIAEANGVSPEAVIDAAIAQATDHINQALEQGNIPDALAQQLFENLDDVFTTMMNHDLSRLLQIGQDRPAGDIAGAVVREVSNVTGLSVREILGRMQQGESMATILEASGANVDDVVNTLTARLTETLEQHIRTILNATRPVDRHPLRQGS